MKCRPTASERLASPPSFERSSSAAELTAPAATTSSPAPVRQVISPGGIEAWHVESPLVPLVALAFTFEGGATQDPADRSGVAQMMARLEGEVFFRALAEQVQNIESAGLAELRRTPGLRGLSSLPLRMTRKTG